MKDIELKLWIRCRDAETSGDDVAREVKGALDRLNGERFGTELCQENCTAIHVINPETELVLS
jgi:hypothetical protein